MNGGSQEVILNDWTGIRSKRKMGFQLFLQKGPQAMMPQEDWIPGLGF